MHKTIMLLKTSSFRMFLVQRIDGMKSSTPTISDYVELLVFNFCLLEYEIGNPVPIESPSLECPLIFVCNPYDPSTYHINIPIPLALSVRGKSIVPLIYIIRCANFN